MGKLFANSRPTAPPPTVAPSSSSPAANSAAAANHTAGIFADMTVDGDEIGTLVVVVDRAKNLPNLKTMGKQDPYCAARLGKEAQKTETDKRGGQTPRWDQELRFTVRDGADYSRLKVSVFNDDKRTDLIGETWIMLEKVLNPGGGAADQWHHLSKQGRYAGEIRIELTYYDTRPKTDKVKRTRVAEKEEVQRAAHMAGPRDLPQVRRRPLPQPITAAADAAAAPVPASHLPSPATGPRSYHTPPRQRTPQPHPNEQYEHDEPVNQYPDSPADIGRHENQPQHAFSRSLPDIHAPAQNQYHSHHQSEAFVHSDGQSMYAPEVDHYRQNRPASMVLPERVYSDDPEAVHCQDEPFAYSDDPYALQVADLAHDAQFVGRHASEPLSARQAPYQPRHDGVFEDQTPTRPMPQPSHSEPVIGQHAHPQHTHGYQARNDFYMQPNPSFAFAPVQRPTYAPLHDDLGINSHDLEQNEYHTRQEPLGRPPPPPRHSNSIPQPQYALRPAPAHYSSQPVRPTGEPPYPSERQSVFDPSSEHAAHLRTQYASVSNPAYPTRPQARAPANPVPSHQQQRVFSDRRHSAVDPDYYMRPQPQPQYPYGHGPPQSPQHGHSQSHSHSSPLTRPTFQQSTASSAALRTTQTQPPPPAERRRDMTPNSMDLAAQEPRATESFAGVPVMRPQAHRVVSPQPPVLPVMINGTAAAGTRAAPVYATPKQSSYNIPRRSLSPNPRTEAVDDHYSPDSYDIYNPATRGRRDRPDDSPSAHREPSPMYGNPDGSRSAPELNHAPPRTTADGNVILSHGQVVHPSDHIPSSAWAPEPERKEKRPAVAVNIRNRFGPREARALDKQSTAVIGSPLAGAGMRKQANEPSSMVNLTNGNIRITPKRTQGPLKPGSANTMMAPPIPAKIPGESTLEEEMRSIDLGPRNTNRGFARGNRFGM